MLVTDGYWNEANPTPLPGGFFSVQSRRRRCLTARPSAAARPNRACSGMCLRLRAARAAVTVRRTAIRRSPISRSSTGRTTRGPISAIRCRLRAGQDNRHHRIDPAATGPSGSLRTRRSTTTRSTIRRAGSTSCSSWSRSASQVTCSSRRRDCTNPNNDLCKLRKGQQNSAGITGWPRPSNNAPHAIDDTWHAAINSRGSYFSASSPSSLVQHLTEIINNILSRRGNSTSLSATMSTLSAGTQGFFGGLRHHRLLGLPAQAGSRSRSPASRTDAIWDASCLLNRQLLPLAPVSATTMPPPPRHARSAHDLHVERECGTGGTAFTLFGNLTTAQQSALNQDPNSTHQVCSRRQRHISWLRRQRARSALDWLRGVRTPRDRRLPLLRHRSSVLGAIINSQPRYVSAPTGGFTDNFPPGSAEAIAATPIAQWPCRAQAATPQFVY